MTDMTDEGKSAFAKEAERRREAGLKLFGQTYDIKDKIKEQGGIWDNRLRTWLVSSEEVAKSLGAVRKEGKHGVYWMIGKAKRERVDQNSPAPPAAAPKEGDNCPACRNEPLDKNLYCWECGYRGT